MKSSHRIAATVALALLVFAGTVIAQDPKTAFNDPEEAGPDFAIQGEYISSSTDGEGEEAWGAQVIALGDGKFDIVAYMGGLPGEGADMESIVKSSGETVDGVLEFECTGFDFHAECKDGVMTILNDAGEVEGKADRVVRESETLGAEPPEGAVVLFDGTSPDAFEGGQMTEDGLLMQGVTSKQLFGSFTIHIEFRAPFQPWARGQGRGNSGFYAQGRYETQMLDSFGLSGEWNECGGVYQIAKPSVNMCYPPLSWQTYDIEFTQAVFDEDGVKTENAKFTVLHNGVKIHDDVELTHATTASPMKEGPEPGPVFLQNHGNPVRYRNIWVVSR